MTRASNINTKSALVVDIAATVSAWLLSWHALAMDGTSINCAVTSDGSEVGDVPLCDELYPEEEHAESTAWQFGLGAGYGRRSNPLINSDNVPVYAIVQLAYFGDRFFFDNGDIGWQLVQEDQWSLNAIAGVGGERSFYSFLNKSPVGILDNFEAPIPGVSAPGPLPEELEGFRPEAPDRDFAIDGGVELFYASEHVDVQVQALTDISDKHNGQQIWFSVGQSITRGRLTAEPSAGFTWLSGRTANYYYGVRSAEATFGLPAYHANQSLNPFVRLTLSYRLTEHWQWVATGQYEFLDDEIADSSSVADDHVSTIFTGLYYAF